MNEIAPTTQKKQPYTSNKKKRTEKFEPHEEEDVKSLEQIVKKVKFEQDKQKDLEELSKLAEPGVSTSRPDVIKVSTNGKSK